ncbi:11184_t:CDS:1, partial [Racocetra persica]
SIQSSNTQGVRCPVRMFCNRTTPCCGPDGVCGAGPTTCGTGCQRAYSEELSCNS